MILARVEKSIVIKAPPEQVWEMLAFDRLPEWGEGFGEGLGERVEYTSEVHISKDKYRVGATAQGIPKKPEDNYCRFEIIESLANNKMKYYAWEKPKYLGILSMFVSYSLETAGTDTKLTYEIESEKYGIFGIFGNFLEKLYFGRMAKKQIQKALENLKSILEKQMLTRRQQMFDIKERKRR
jgi:carbon monoxide dehydrogenase subunit G